MDLQTNEEVDLEQQDGATPPEPQQPDPREERLRLLSEEVKMLRETVTSYRMPSEPAPVQAAPAPPPDPKFEFYSPRQIAKAVEDGELETAEAMREHNNATRVAQAEWKQDKRFRELQTGGQAAIDQVLDRVYKDEFKHLDIPDVKREYEAQLQVLKQHGGSINAEARRYIYRQAVGAHVEKIVEKERQVSLRAAEPASEPQKPTGKSGRSTGKMSDAPLPSTAEELFGPEGAAALNMAGRTMEDELRRRGYKDVASYMKAVGSYRG